jgi:hypothetical protein
VQIYNFITKVHEDKVDIRRKVSTANYKCIQYSDHIHIQKLGMTMQVHCDIFYNGFLVNFYQWLSTPQCSSWRLRRMIQQYQDTSTCLYTFQPVQDKQTREDLGAPLWCGIFSLERSCQQYIDAKKANVYSETMLTGESRFQISTPQGIWTCDPCGGKQTG